MPEELPDWADKAVEEGELRWGHGRYRTSAHDESAFALIPRIDFSLVQHAFAGILLPDNAVDGRERAQYLRFWEQAVTCALATVHSYDANGNVIDADTDAGLPYQDETWLFDQIAVVILQTRMDEKPDRLWKPFVGLGPLAHYHIEYFCRAWVSQGLRWPDPGTFVCQWQTMLDFVSSTAPWEKGDQRRRYRASELWRHLLGIEDFCALCWQPEHQSIVRQMKPYFERWAKDHLRESDSSKAFVSWLKRDAARPIRLDAIVWLERAAADADQYYWRDEYVAEGLAELADLTWQVQRRELAQDAVADSAMKRLVQMLADRHEALAMDLQRRMATGG